MRVNIPYGRTFISLDLPDRNIVAILKSVEYKGEVDQAEIVRKALNNPYS
jgi:hypothetical protein